ncbi:MAG: hypothetical protein JNM70_10875 [Anaerolineae bacterium]|nr:hypothetical protein [Anaerolineae bacterium]
MKKKIKETVKSNMQNTVWIYYRLFLLEPGNFGHFLSLLNDVVSPTVEQYAHAISHFHFFRYAGTYEMHVEGDRNVTNRLSDVSDDDFVEFIRLRIQVQPEIAQQVRDTLLSLASKSAAIRGCEEPSTPYDAIRDLGGRFGRERTPLVMNLLEASARLALDYAKEKEPFDPSPNKQGGSRGLVHLVSNTLQYQITILTDANVWFQVWGQPMGGDFPARTQLL